MEPRPVIHNEEQVKILSDLLQSPGFLGAVLRVLVGRVVSPARPYTGKELETLLLVTCALDRAGMWPWR